MKQEFDVVEGPTVGGCTGCDALEPDGQCGVIGCKDAPNCGGHMILKKRKRKEEMKWFNLFLGMFGAITSLVGSVMLMLILLENRHPIWTLSLPLMGGACAMLCCLLIALRKEP